MKNSYLTPKIVVITVVAAKVMAASLPEEIPFGGEDEEGSNW